MGNSKVWRSFLTKAVQADTAGVLTCKSNMALAAHTTSNLAQCPSCFARCKPPTKSALGARSSVSTSIPAITQYISNASVRPQQRLLALQAMPAQVSQEQEQAIPYGYLWYETMILLRPDLEGEQRDVELARFEAFLQREQAVGIDVMVRASSQALAYPIKGFWEGIYVLYTYAANPRTAKGVQKLLSTPQVGSESVVLRHMTFKT